MSSLQKSLFPVYLLTIISLGFVLQQYLFLNWDVGHLLHEAQASLHHGEYVRDFFTPNPPLILWLYSPPLWLSQFSNIDITMSFQLYIVSVMLVSLGLCFSSINHIFKHSELNIAKHVLLYALPFVFLIVPMYDFGQRDHLFVILTCPYLFLMSDRLCTATQYSRLKCCLIGFLAFLGFAIKPQFIITFLLVELYYIGQIKNIKAWWRWDIAVIVSLGILYLGVLGVFYKVYTHVVIPYLTRNYYASISSSFYSLLSPLITLFCFLPFLLYNLFKASRIDRVLSVFYVALLGALLSYFMQHTDSYQHLIPALSYSLLISFLMVAWVSTENTNYFIIFMISLCFFAYPAYFLYDRVLKGEFYKGKFLLPIRDFLSLRKAQSLYVFSIATNCSFPVSLYLPIESLGRFDCLWPVMGVVRHKINAADEKYLIDIVTEDLEQKKPEYIFIDRRNYKEFQYDINFNYIQFFSQNIKFKQEWQHYHFVTTLEEPDFYKLDIYQRGI